MTGNDMGGSSPLLPSGALDLPPEEAGRRRSPRKLVITGGPFGPQMVVFQNPAEEPEERERRASAAPSLRVPKSGCAAF